MHETLQKKEISAMVKYIHLAHVCVKTMEKHSGIQKRVFCEQPHNIKCVLNIEVYSK